MKEKRAGGLFLELVCNHHHHLTTTAKDSDILRFHSVLIQKKQTKSRLSSIYINNYKIQKLLPPKQLFFTRLYFIIYYASIFRATSIR